MWFKCHEGEPETGHRERDFAIYRRILEVDSKVHHDRFGLAIVLRQLVIELQLRPRKKLTLRAYSPNSRPRPEFLYPPKGMEGLQLVS